MIFTGLIFLEKTWKYIVFWLVIFCLLVS